MTEEASSETPAVPLLESPLWQPQQLPLPCSAGVNSGSTAIYFGAFTSAKDRVPSENFCEGMCLNSPG